MNEDIRRTIAANHERARLETQARVIRIQLEALYNALTNTEYQPPLRDELLKRIGDTTLPQLPSIVTSLIVSDRVTLTRPQEEVQRVDKTQRVTWNLADVDTYGKQIAEKLSMQWSPLFVHRQRT